MMHATTMKSTIARETGISARRIKLRKEDNGTWLRITLRLEMHDSLKRTLATQVQAVLWNNFDKWGIWWHDSDHHNDELYYLNVSIVDQNNLSLVTPFGMGTQEINSRILQQQAQRLAGFRILSVDSAEKAKQVDRLAIDWRKEGF